MPPLPYLFSVLCASQFALSSLSLLLPDGVSAAETPF